MQAQKPICESKEICPEIAIHKKESEYSVFVSIPDSSLKITSVSFITDLETTKFDTDSEMVERSISGDNTLLIMKVNKDFLQKLVGGANTKVIVETSTGPVVGTIKDHKHSSDLYSAIVKFLN